MSRGRKPKVEEVIPAFTTVTFKDREFEIHPIVDREDDFAYDDAAEFMILAVPVGTKVFSELLTLGEKDPKAIERIKKGAESNENQADVIVDLVGFLSKSDFTTLLQEVSEVLPKLAAIACRYTDPNVVESDIKKWTKNPLHKEMWKAVVAQMKADNILAQMGGLQGLLGEFRNA